MIKRSETNVIVFHHSLAKTSSVDIIRQWHIERGFEDVGYHFVIRKDGNIEEGRDIRFVGAHAAGKNHDSIGVCFEGDFRIEDPTQEQIEAAVILSHGLFLRFKKKLAIDFHRGFEDNPCPGPRLDRVKLVQLIQKGAAI